MGGAFIPNKGENVYLANSPELFKQSLNLANGNQRTGDFTEIYTREEQSSSKRTV